MSLEGPAVLALITVFGIGMVCGALLLGAVIVATVVVIQLRGKMPASLDVDALATLDKASKTIGPELERFIGAINAVKGTKNA